MASDWVKVELSSFCSKIGSGATPRGGSKVYLDEGEVTLIRSQNIYNDRFVHDGLTFIDNEHAEQLSNVAVEEGDILLNITGDSVARCCQVDPAVLPARVNQHVAIIRPLPEEFNPRFIRYFMVSPIQQAHMLSLSHAGATRKALTKGMIESFKVPKPELNIQNAIADILGALDDKIDLNRRMNETLEAMAAAIFKSWFVDFDPVHAKAAGKKPFSLDPQTAKLFPREFQNSKLGKIPKGWECTTLGHVTDIYDSKRIPLSGRERAKRAGKYRYYGAAGILDHVDDYLFEGVHILMGEDGSVVTDDGYPIVQYVWGQFWVNNHAHVLKGANDISDEHLYLFLKQVHVKPYVTGAVQPKINQTNMKSIPFILPPKSINSSFINSLSPLFEKYRLNSDGILSLAAIRDTLLPKLLSGEIRVGEAEKIVEEAV